MSTTAFAGFDLWTVETEDDPFSGGKHAIVSFSSSLRSGIFIFCETSGHGVRIRAIPGFEYIEALSGFIPETSLAIDGKILTSASGKTGRVGENLAAVDVELDAQKSEEFVKAFSTAKKQIAVKDGISDQPHLLSARGSTNSGKALLECISSQKINGNENTQTDTDSETNDAAPALPSPTTAPGASKTEMSMEDAMLELKKYAASMTVEQKQAAIETARKAAEEAAKAAGQTADQVKTAADAAEKAIKEALDVQ